MSNDTQKPTEQDYFDFNQLAQGNIDTQLVLLCLELNLPKHLADGAKSLAYLAKETKCKVDTLKRFLRGMETLSLVKEIETDHYQKGHLLDFVYSVNAPGFGKTAYQAWAHCLDSVRNGEPGWDRHFGCSFFDHLEANPEQSDLFDQWNDNTAFFMDPLIERYNFDQFDKIVDLGGGKGSFVIKLLEANPKLKGIVFDRDDVIKNTNRCLEAAKLNSTIANRLETQAGSFFDKVPEEANCYMLCRVLLNWNDDQVIDIFKTCMKSMGPEDKLLILDFYIPDSEEPSYPYVVKNDLSLLVNFGGGLRDTKQWLALFEKVGLDAEVVKKPEFSSMILLEAKKK